MKISIVMATYNGAKYLQEQLDSFVAQTRRPDELVVCDDKSTDETVAILTKFAKVAPFEVKIFINEKNIGYAQNFSHALSLCEGDLVFLSDQDDVWFDNKILTIQQLAKKDESTQMFMNDAELVYHDLSPTGLTKQSQIRTAGFSQSSFVMGCCMAIRTSFLKHLLPIPHQFEAHDVWLSQIGEGLKYRKVLPITLQLYRRYNYNNSHFIANSTQKINTIDRIVWQLKKHKGKKNSEYLLELEKRKKRSQITINFLYSCLQKEEVSEELKDRINNFLSIQLKSKKSLEERIKIKKNNFISRIYYGYKFLLKGGYKEFSGIQSYFKDILI